MTESNTVNSARLNLHSVITVMMTKCFHTTKQLLFNKSVFLTKRTEISVNHFCNYAFGHIVSVYSRVT